jgi:hypothetical protein
MICFFLWSFGNELIFFELSVEIGSFWWDRTGCVLFEFDSYLGCFFVFGMLFVCFEFCFSLFCMFFDVTTLSSAVAYCVFVVRV